MGMAKDRGKRKSEAGYDAPARKVEAKNQPGCPPTKNQVKLDTEKSTLASLVCWYWLSHWSRLGWYQGYLQAPAITDTAPDIYPAPAPPFNKIDYQNWFGPGKTA